MKNQPPMRVGADYYPEHWPRERWDTDAQLMRQAGFNITRMAEFAWAKLEPTEGQFDFDWLEEAVNLFGRYGVQTILCTPTPTMPKWVYDAYPDTVSMDEKGRPVPFGNRQNNCFTSPSYRKLSRRITQALALRFKDNPHVIGWQLDNELGGPICFCAQCEAHFQRWLAAKYKDIGALNEAWGAVFWSQTYGDFGQTHLPRHKHSSPSLYLDFRRFHSQAVVGFAAEQTQIIRDICPRHFITHNCMGMHDAIDYGALGELLDFVSEDYYYNYGSGDWDSRFESYVWGAERLDFIRGLKGKKFWIMENSAGALGWETYGRNLRPGELRRMTFQNMAHGMEGQIWFRWRTSRFGTEQYWHGLLDHSGIPARRYNEAAAASKDLQTVFAETAGGTIPCHVAIVTDYEDQWALGQQPNSTSFSYAGAIAPYYKALSKRGVNVDFIRGFDSLGGYKLVILPYKYLLTKEDADSAIAFVKSGGTLLTTCRTGVKNTHNVPHEMILPGYLREAAGIRVEEYEAIDSYEIEYRGGAYKGGVLADWILPETAQTLGRYASQGISYAAVTENTFGQGKVFYAGAVPGDELAERIVEDALSASGIAAFSLPEHTELVTHRNGEDTFYFLLNHSDEEQRFVLEGVQGADLLSGRACEGAFSLAANDVAVIKKGTL